MRPSSSSTRGDQVADQTNASLAVLALAATKNASCTAAPAARVSDSAARDKDQSTIMARCFACSRWYDVTVCTTGGTHCCIAITSTYTCACVRVCVCVPSPGSFRKTTPYQVRRSVLDSLIRSHLSAEDTFEACEHLVGIDHTTGDQEALATLRYHQRSASLKTISLKPQRAKRPGSPTSFASKKPATEELYTELTDGICFQHDNVRDFYTSMRWSAHCISHRSSSCAEEDSAATVWDDAKKKGGKMSKEEKERERSVKKDNILKSLASQRLTEKEILRDVGDSRCAPPLTCEPFIHIF